MAELGLAANQIGSYHEFGSVQFSPWGHFQVVFRADQTPPQEIEVQAPKTEVLGTWVYSGKGLPQDHTENTPFYSSTNTTQYAYTKIDLGDRSAENVWDILKQVHAEFAAQGQGINYDTYQNSNSYATTVLSVVGINIADYVAKTTPSNVSGTLQIPEKFPGIGVNVLENPSTAIALDLKGTPERDIIRTGAKDDTVEGLGGKDTLDGGDGIDKAVFSDIWANYTKVTNEDGTVTIEHVGGTKADGTDTLANIERLVFADQSFYTDQFPESAPKDMPVAELSDDLLGGPSPGPGRPDFFSALEKAEQDLGGNPPTGSAPEPGSGPEPVGVALNNLPPPPPVPAPPSAPPPSTKESAPEPPASETVQDLGGDKPSGDGTTENEKIAFSDLPPPPDIPPPPPPSFSPGSAPEPDARSEAPSPGTVQDLGGDIPTVPHMDLSPPPDDILLA